ncbi:MAG: arsenate reductase ArsC [Caldilineaceae bacterium]
MKQVLFLCTGNSARSQMAEAIVNARLGHDFNAMSAGTKPSGYVHPAAVKALGEIGIQHVGHSQHVDDYRDVVFDLVITVCDDAAENCPVWLGRGERVHIGFPDPAAATGTDDQVLDAFRAVRRRIEAEVLDFLKQWQVAV